MIISSEPTDFMLIGISTDKSWAPAYSWALRRDKWLSTGSSNGSGSTAFKRDCEGEGTDEGTDDVYSGKMSIFAAKISDEIFSVIEQVFRIIPLFSLIFRF